MMEGRAEQQRREDSGKGDSRATKERGKRRKAAAERTTEREREWVVFLFHCVKYRVE